MTSIDAYMANASSHVPKSLILVFWLETIILSSCPLVLNALNDKALVLRCGRRQSNTIYSLRIILLRRSEDTLEPKGASSCTKWAPWVSDALPSGVVKLERACPSRSLGSAASPDVIAGLCVVAAVKLVVGGIGSFICRPPDRW